MDRREHRIVVKIGTATLTGGQLEPDQAYLDAVADQVVTLREQGYEVLIVSSGAIGSGMGLLGRTERVREVKLRQALAAVGQPLLVAAWERAFSRHDVHVAQLLLTYEALRDRRSFLNMRNATEELLSMGVVPIINENDTVSTAEIEGSPRDPESARPKAGQIEAGFGDNDRLSAYVASKARAGLLVILSDVAGLYTKPPDHPGAELVPVVEQVTDEIYEMAGAKTGSVVGRGGMTSKLDAARIATRAGTPVVICDGREPRVLSRVLEGEALGTRFLAHGSGTEKEQWLSIAKPQGRIQVDEGAAAALAGGKHLLPAGITGVEGSFPAGAVVAIISGDRVVAKAISHVSAKELESVKGLRSDRARERLGLDGSVNVTRKGDIVLIST